MSTPLYNKYKFNCYKRRLKSLTEPILLLTTSNIYKYNFYGEIDSDFIIGILFKILGTSNKIYDVQVWNTYGIINYSCTCPDYMMKNNVCKHIYWLGNLKFNSMNTCNWNTEEYNGIILENWIVENNYIGRNDTCPICLDGIDYENEMTLCCIYQCQNSVHSECWKKFYNMTDKKACVMCRANIMPTITNY